MMSILTTPYKNYIRQMTLINRMQFCLLNLDFHAIDYVETVQQTVQLFSGRYRQLDTLQVVNRYGIVTVSRYVAHSGTIFVKHYYVACHQGLILTFNVNGICRLALVYSYERGRQRVVTYCQRYESVAAFGQRPVERRSYRKLLIYLNDQFRSLTDAQHKVVALQRTAVLCVVGRRAVLISFRGALYRASL